MADLSTAVSRRIDIPADPPLVFQALCLAMSERRSGRPIVLVERAFPEEASGTTGLWLDTKEQDIIVLEESLEPDHKLVVLGHELWHVEAGHRHDLGGAAVAARAALAGHQDWPEIARTIAARSHSHQADEVDAERFGILMGSSMGRWLATPGTRRLDDVARRIGESLGYSGPQGN
ncbi:toxin-antitoxin system, toxin component [Streptomyces sp. Ag109_O5-1]|uniref:toxin-antitoxin system, toxin component n=1 Tax=Streptomyces sp. Ag109_O5-1 TaxID=1938851 RepID=UPI000F4FA630|nr:toxin-antitoxin system, toxin component [Streptomyces sp. Ag109_O5-1]